MFVSGVKISGDCEDWTSFSNGALFLPSNDLYFGAVTATFASQNVQTGWLNNGTFFCNDPIFMKGFVKSLQTGVRFLSTCNQNEWRVYSCSGVVFVCVNCRFSCGSDACPGTLLSTFSSCLDCNAPYLSFGVLRLV